MTKQSLFNDDSPRGGAATGRVTEVAPLTSDPNMKRIMVEGKVIARLPSGDVEALKIEAGRKWTAALAKRVQDALNANKARRHAMTLLGKRSLSRGELIERLLRRGHSRSIAQRIADDLEEHHWIDDESFAKSLAQELVQQKGASRTMVIDRLVKRKIDEPLARQVTDHLLREVDPLEAASALACKRLESMKNASPQQAARRIAGYLARRGFDEEVVTEALDRIGLLPRE